MIEHGLVVLEGDGFDSEEADAAESALTPEQQESIAFYRTVRDQVVIVADMPLGLSLPALLVALVLGGYQMERWRELIDDARLLFDRHGRRRIVRDYERAMRRARR